MGRCRKSPAHPRARGRTEHGEPQEHEGAACGWREVRGRKREVGLQSGRVEHGQLCLTHSLRRWSLCLAQGAAETQERRVRAGVFTLPLSCTGDQSGKLWPHVRETVALNGVTTEGPHTVGPGMNVKGNLGTWEG